MKLLDQEYKLIKDNGECFDLELVKEKITDYFKDYDYIVGDIAYSKLRLKGFTKKDNKMNNEINDFDRLDKYILENCAYGCKYFILEKIN
ncbi:MAG: YutD family protein [Tenericutes bacterium]|nr:YutD family protein [Mycoplasmatota bacterium]